ncbi:MAG: hypothetical protein HQ522_06525 [Bacteroidetes bacterium]|nr:hypothetical protein [Bacteroidota bacterium]
MSVGIITKIEHRILPDGVFAEFSFTGFSGTILKTTAQTPAGTIHETTIRLKIPEVQSVITNLLDGLLHRKAQYQITDGNGKIHLVGDDSYPARLEYVQGLDGQPGSWNGYTVTINHKSPVSYTIS